MAHCLAPRVTGADDDHRLPCGSAALADSSPFGPGPARIISLLDGAADGQAVNAQRWLANADRHALAVLAASADPVVKRQVVADHRDPGQCVRAIADERRPLHWIGELAVPDRCVRPKCEHSNSHSYIAC